jgi:hypothetical protein
MDARDTASRDDVASDDSALPAPRFHRAKLLAAGCIVVAYLLTTVYFFGRHVLGDSLSHRVAYFWTWDMFPGYTSTATRHVAIGETADGEFVQLYPSESQQFRWGIDGDMTRIDMLPSVEGEISASWFLAAVKSTLERTRTATDDDPITRIYLAEEYWPLRYNLSDDLYDDVYGETLMEAVVDLAQTNQALDNSPLTNRTHPTHWRVLLDVDVARTRQSDGRWEWTFQP